MKNFSYYENVMDFVQSYIDLEDGANIDLQGWLEQEQEVFLEEFEDHYLKNEVERVCAAMNVPEILQDNDALKKKLKGISMLDVIHIASKVAFMYGLMVAENERLKFYDEVPPQNEYEPVVE